MGQPVLRAEQRGDRFLQGRQEHHHALQQRAAAQPLPLPLRRHQRLQEEEECLHAEVREYLHVFALLLYFLDTFFKCMFAFLLTITYLFTSAILHYKHHT